MWFESNVGREKRSKRDWEDVAIQSDRNHKDYLWNMRIYFAREKQKKKHQMKMKFARRYFKNMFSFHLTCWLNRRTNSANQPTFFSFRFPIFRRAKINVVGIAYEITILMIINYVWIKKGKEKTTWKKNHKTNFAQRNEQRKEEKLMKLMLSIDWRINRKTIRDDGKKCKN